MVFGKINFWLRALPSTSLVYHFFIKWFPTYFFKITHSLESEAPISIVQTGRIRGERLGEEK